MNMPGIFISPTFCSVKCRLLSSPHFADTKNKLRLHRAEALLKVTELIWNGVKEYILLSPRCLVVLFLSSLGTRVTVANYDQHNDSDNLWRTTQGGVILYCAHIFRIVMLTRCWGIFLLLILVPHNQLLGVWLRINHVLLPGKKPLTS